MLSWTRALFGELNSTSRNSAGFRKPLLFYPSLRIENSEIPKKSDHTSIALRPSNRAETFSKGVSTSLKVILSDRDLHFLATRTTTRPENFVIPNKNNYYLASNIFWNTVLKKWTLFYLNLDKLNRSDSVTLAVVQKPFGSLF